MIVPGIGTEEIDQKLPISTVQQILALRRVVSIEASNNLLTAAREEARRGIEQERLDQERRQKRLADYIASRQGRTTS